jgi:hypothetical protein
MPLLWLLFHLLRQQVLRRHRLVEADTWSSLADMGYLCSGRTARVRRCKATW